jgi:predicted TIM-barrel fold metal-dependent hydrolase
MVACRVVDVAVHSTAQNPDDIRRYLPKALRSRPFPGPYRYLYPPPTGVAPYGCYTPQAYESPGAPGADPAFSRAHLREHGVDEAILLPLTRGVLPNLDLGSAICAATNDWLADTWLDGSGEPDGGPAFLGSIRLNPLDVDAAVAELKRWAGDQRMVQVAVPLEAHLPYGHRVYHRLWEAVAASGLPVAVRSDGYSGTSFHPTPGGYPRHHAEFVALQQNNFIYHLTSLIAEGVFERLPALKFVFVDGGFDVLTPLMWRMDMDHPIAAVEAPWVTRRPSRYLTDHVRFVVSRFDGPTDPAVTGAWADVSDASELLVYGSGYPGWQAFAPAEVLPELDEAARRSILGENARSFYPLPHTHSV